jgi:hypothetical protein
MNERTPQFTIGSILKFTPRDLQRLREKGRTTNNASPASSVAGKLWGMFGSKR